MMSHVASVIGYGCGGCVYSLGNNLTTFHKYLRLEHPRASSALLTRARTKTDSF
jgi:hypothetical protein